MSHSLLRGWLRYRPWNLSAVSIAVAVVVVGVASDVRAQSPIPAFTGQRVSLSGVANDEWQLLAAHISEIEKRSLQTYYAVIVQSAGAGHLATPQYTDRLYAEWKQQAARSQVPLDPERAVLIVLALQNRQLSVHAGSELQQKYGLRGQTIDRQLVTPFFIPHARAGNYPEGVRILINKIDNWITDADQRSELQRKQAVARAEQIKQDAAAMLATARQLHVEVQQLVSDQSESGLDLSRQSDRVEQTQLALAGLENEIEKNGPQALKTATQAQQELAAIRNEIRQLAANQHDAQEMIAMAEKQVSQIAELIEQHGRQGLAVRPAGVKLDQAIEALRTAGAAIHSDPTKSLQIATDQRAALGTLLTAVKQLPAQHEIVRTRLSALQEKHARLQQTLQTAAANGVDVEQQSPVVEKLQSDTDQAKELLRSDYAAANELITATNRDIDQQLNVLESATSQRYFVTRTVPLWISGGLVGFGMLTLLTLRLLHIMKRRPLEENLKQFKTKVVHLSDSLDELKERHRMLPYTDEDFKEPMTGETLDAYDSVQESLEQFRQRWLTLMDIWEDVQHHIKTEHFFGRRKLSAALTMLASAPVDDVLHAIREDCIETLDQLEDAHEQQLQIENELNAAQARLNEQLQALRAVDLSTDPYDAEFSSAWEQRNAVADQRVSDPVGTRQVDIQVLNELRRIGRWTEQILHHHQGTAELTKAQADLTDSTQQHRDQGFLFCEEGSDPSVLFPGIRHHCSECLVLLNSGEAKTAGEHLSQGFGLIASARQRITRQVQCRDICLSEASVRPQQQERLRQSLNDARQSVGKLQLSFSDESWADVSDNVELAEQAISDCATLLSEAAENGSEERQFYVTAAEQYERVQDLQNRTAALTTAVDQKLHDLEILREQTQTEFQNVSQLSEQVRSLLSSHTADRPAANHRFRHAEEALAEAETQSQLTRVDWQDVRVQLDFARGEFETARNLAQEDLRLASQAAQEISQADREIRQASSFYSHGFSADVSTATQEIEQARAALQGLNYENAIRLANQAVASARDGVRIAENLALAKQRRADQRRRQRQTAMNVGATSSALAGTSSLFGSSGFGSSSNSGSFSTGASSSSWSSGTSVSSW